MTAIETEELDDEKMLYRYELRTSGRVDEQIFEVAVRCGGGHVEGVALVFD